MDTEITFQTLSVHGADAQSFLQGQLTCDVNTITDENRYGAYCDHRGRMIANFALHKQENDFLLTLPASMIAAVQTQLQKFGAFSKVTIAPKGTPFKADKKTYIESGIAFIYPKTSLAFTPQMINWEKHGGVSFEKGCYVGQEIVARTQHLGKLKRHLHKITINEQINAHPGDSITNGNGATVGTLCDALYHNDNTIGLAVIHDSACGSALFLAEKTIHCEMSADT